MIIPKGRDFSSSLDYFSVCLFFNVYLSFSLYDTNLKYLCLCIFLPPQLNYKAKHENEKFKCHIPPDTPAFIQHKLNAYNLSDVSTVYVGVWNKRKYYECLKGPD